MWASSSKRSNFEPRSAVRTLVELSNFNDQVRRPGSKSEFWGFWEVQLSLANRAATFDIYSSHICNTHFSLFRSRFPHLRTSHFILNFALGRFSHLRSSSISVGTISACYNSIKKAERVFFWRTKVQGHTPNKGALRPLRPVSWERKGQVLGRNFNSKAGKNSGLSTSTTTCAH